MPSAMARFQAWPTGITARMYDERSGRLVVRGAHVDRHGFDGLSEPVAGCEVGLVGARPGRDQAHVDLRIRSVEQLREPRRVVDDLAGVAGRVCIERAVALHDHVVPGACDERRLLLMVKIQVHAGGRFEADVVGKSRLAGEALEQCRHTADAFAIEVRHGLGPKASVPAATPRRM